MLTRKFSRREKILLLLFIVLLIACLYYILIFQPVNETIELAAERQAEAESGLAISGAMLVDKQRMEEALAQLSSDSSAIVPDYDNARRVVELLNGAMLSTGTYNMTFRPLVISEPIVSRVIDIDFTCDSYDTAKYILAMLHDGPYRCEISAVSMTLNAAAQSARASAEAEAAAAEAAAAAAAAAAGEAYVPTAREVFIPSLNNSGLNVRLTATFYEFLP